MRYLSDTVKRASNLKKHGYDFADAQLVIESGQTVTFEDNRFAYDETKFITLGLMHDHVVLIVTTETDEDIRVISMRKADRYEQKIYFEHF